MAKLVKRSGYILVSELELWSSKHVLPSGAGLFPSMSSIPCNWLNKLKLLGHKDSAHPRQLSMSFDLFITLFQGPSSLGMHHHSKKLAIAFGLMATLAGTTLWVFKNLYVAPAAMRQPSSSPG